MGLLSKRVDITSIHITFSDGSEMLVTEFPKGNYITEHVDYGRLQDKSKPERHWEIKWRE